MTIVNESSATGVSPVRTKCTSKMPLAPVEVHLTRKCDQIPCTATATSRDRSIAVNSCSKQAADSAPHWACHSLKATL